MQTITIKLNSSVSNFTLKVENGEYQVVSNGDYTLSIDKETDQTVKTTIIEPTITPIDIPSTPVEVTETIKSVEFVADTTPTTKFSAKELKSLKDYTNTTIIKYADGKPVILTKKPTNVATYDIMNLPYTDQTLVYFIEKVKDMPGKKKVTVLEQWDGLNEPYTTYRLYKDTAANIDKYKHLNIVAAQVQVFTKDEFFGIVVLNSNLEQPNGDYWYNNQNLKKEAQAVYDGMDYTSNNPLSVVSRYLTGVDCLKLCPVGRIADYTPVPFDVELLKDTKVSMFKFKCGAGNVHSDQFITL